ncbi:hypothetical protein ZWY2020_040477 [Hordeum vulgare]|nr:hypothetical protein ZWY2020_040477 [Hordeum vulgare]
MKAACLLLACVRCAGTGPARPIRRRAPPTLVLLKLRRRALTKDTYDLASLNRSKCCAKGICTECFL